MSAASNPYEPPRSDLLPVAETGRPANAFGDSPIATFTIVRSRVWLRRAFSRWYKFHRPYGLSLFGWILYPTLSYFVSNLFSNIREADRFASAIFWMQVVVGFVVAASASICIDRWMSWLFIPRTMNQTTTQTLYRDGLVSDDSQTTSRVSWITIRSVVRYADGILLNAGLANFYWLPFDDLKAGKIDDIDSLLKANFPSYQQQRA